MLTGSLVFVKQGVTYSCLGMEIKGFLHRHPRRGEDVHV